MLGRRLISLASNRTTARNALLILLTLGAGYLVASVWLEIEAVEVVSDGTRRQVGYVFAPNWSWNYIALLPLAAYFLLTLMGECVDALRRLVGRGMVRRVEGDSLEPVSDGDELVDAFAEDFAFPAWIWSVLAALLFAFTYVEWRRDSYGPLFLGESPPEMDWSVAAMFGTETVSAGANAAFSLVVYTLGQGVFLAVGTLFLFFIVVYASFLRDQRTADGGYVILPDPDSEDRRRGFELFEPAANRALAFAFVLVAATYFVVVQNQFLNHFHEAPSIVSLVLDDWVPPRIKALGTSIGFDTSTGLAVTAGFGTLLVVFLFSKFTLDWLADAARDRAREAWTDGTEVLDDMVTWPYGWLTDVWFFVALTLAVGGLILFKLFPVLFLAVLSSIVGAILTGVKSKLGGSPTGGG